MTNHNRDESDEQDLSSKLRRAAAGRNVTKVKRLLDENAGEIMEDSNLALNDILHFIQTPEGVTGMEGILYIMHVAMKWTKVQILKSFSLSSSKSTTCSVS